jgi:hypothetical protein
MHHEATYMFYKHIYPNLFIHFAANKELKRFRHIRAAHPHFRGTVKLGGSYDTAWNRTPNWRVHGILRAVKRDVQAKSLLTDEEMDCKDNMLFNLAWKNKEAVRTEHDGRVHLLRGEDWELQVRWKNIFYRNMGEILDLSGHLGRVDALWERFPPPREGDVL